MSEKYEVEFEYFSNYENEEDNYSNNVTETFLVDSFDELCGMLGITDDEELFDMDYDDSEGINFSAKSEMIEAGRNVLSIRDENHKVVWSST